MSAFGTRGVCHQLFEHCAERHDLVTTQTVVDELRLHLPSKFGFTRIETEEAVSLILLLSQSVKPAHLPKDACRDQGDVPILGAALAGKCDCVITGDRDLLDLNTYHSIPILSTSQFWRFENARPAR